MTACLIGIRVDRVETRLGTLNFFDGFPDKGSAEKLFDNLDFQRAVQAYLLALPPVNQAANRDAIRDLGPVNQTIPIFEQLVDSRSIFLTANDNTVYLGLARPEQRAGGGGGASEGARSGQRHVVSVGYRCGHHRPGQG